MIRLILIFVLILIYISIAIFLRKKYQSGNIKITQSDFFAPNSSQFLSYHLIIINPIGGNRNSIQLFNQIIAPYLKKAKINFKAIVTTHPDHGSNIVKNADLSLVIGIIAVGGDGHLNHIINGILARSDHELILKKIAVGCIAAGTGNGVSKSLQILDPMESMKAIIQNKTKQINIMHLSTSQHGLLSLTHGFIAEFDKLMEQTFRSIKLPPNQLSNWLYKINGLHDISFQTPGFIRWSLNQILIPIYLILVNPHYQINLNIIPKHEIDQSF